MNPMESFQTAGPAMEYVIANIAGKISRNIQDLNCLITNDRFDKTYQKYAEWNMHRLKELGCCGIILSERKIHFTIYSKRIS